MKRWEKGLIPALILALGIPLLSVPAAAGEAGAGEYGGFLVACADGALAAYEAGVLTLSGPAEVSGGADGERIVLKGECSLTLSGVDIRAAGGAGITLAPGTDAELILAPGSRNFVTGDANYAGIQVTFAEDDSASLIIRGEGKLTAQGGRNAAGVGGSFRESVFYGDITVESGSLIAQGGSNAAGIGSGVNSMGDQADYKMETQTWGAITISGGNVTANGSGSGAGIGGGNHADSGRILITGGTVNASGASGIGSGVGSASTDWKGRYGPGYYYGSVEIRGGTVTARAGENGAGIGGAMYCDGRVTISGGQITASGGAGGQLRHGGAGIGGGYEGHGEVTVTGGSVITTGGGGAAGIGSGSAANADPKRENQSRGDSARLSATVIRVENGVITATGGAYGGAGIGGGVGADRVEISLTGGSVETNGGGGTRARPLGGAGLGSAAAGAESEEGQPVGGETGTKISLTGGSVSAVGGWGAAGIGGGGGNASPVSLVVDRSADITAFSDGIRFALDTRSPGEGEISAARVLQGTFVDLSDFENMEYEGLAVDLRSDLWEETVILPEGCRSFARTVPAGIYSISAGPEIFAVGETEKSIPGRLTGGSAFAVTDDGMADGHFLTVCTRRQVRVVWDDQDDLDGSRRNLSLFLIQDGQQAAEATVSAEDSSPEIIVWDDLPKYSSDGSREREYAVVPGEMAGYAPTVAEDGDTIVVTLTHMPELVCPEGFLYWLGDSRTPRPEQVELTLLADGKAVTTITVEPGENGIWRYSFGPRLGALERKKINYTVQLNSPGLRAVAVDWDLLITPESAP